MTKIIRFFSICLACLCMAMPASAQHSAKEYLQKAEEMYGNVWSRYRVAKHPGLFLENYPSTKNDTITYMEGGGVKEKEVSFLWPFSGVFSATNVLIKFPALQSKYKRFLDTCVTGVEKYRDDKRSPVGYQAYPSIFEKSDRYYDDNGLVGID
ncbi:MAG: hydrolase, partial [Sphingobacteriales bacterium]